MSSASDANSIPDGGTPLSPSGKDDEADEGDGVPVLASKKNGEGAKFGGSKRLVKLGRKESLAERFSRPGRQQT